MLNNGKYPCLEKHQVVVNGNMESYEYTLIS